MVMLVMWLRQSSVSAGFYKGVLEPGSIKLTTPNAVTRKQQGEVWCLRFLRSPLVQCEDSVFFFFSWVKQHLRGTTLKDEDLTNHGNENREIGSCLPDGLQWSYLTLDSPHREDAVDRWSWKLFRQVRTVKNTSFNALAAFGMFSAETVYYDQL